MSMSDAELQAHVRDQTGGVLSRSVVMLTSKVATWALAFIMTVMVPRYLGAAAWGRLYFAISLTTIFSIVVEFGLNALVTKEVSRHPGQSTTYLFSAAILKAGLWVLALAVMAGAMGVSSYPTETRLAVLVLAVSVLVSSMSSLMVAVLQAHDRAGLVAVSSALEKAVYVALGVGALLLGYGVVAVALVMLAGALAGFALDVFWLLRLSRRVPIHEEWQGLQVRSVFKRAVPFFSVLVFGAVYFRIDVVMLSALKPDAVVGWYGSAYRLFETTNFIPEAFLFSLFPMICRFSAKDDRALALAAQKGLDLLLLAGVPIAVGTAVLADNVIGTLYGHTQYAQSVPVLRTLSIAIVLMYANGVFTYLLIASDRQHKLATTAGIAAVLNVGLNLVLIPPYGAMGAAVSTVLTESVVVALNFAFLPRPVAALLRPHAALKAVVAAAVMSAPLIALRNESLLVLVPLGVVTYLISVWALRILPVEDWQMMKTALLRTGAAS